MVWWYNHLELNVKNTEEMIVDFSKDWCIWRTYLLQER